MIKFEALLSLSLSLSLSLFFERKTYLNNNHVYLMSKFNVTPLPGVMGVTCETLHLTPLYYLVSKNKYDMLSF